MYRTKRLALPSFADIARRLILSWLIAVFIEYAALPADLRSLASLAGIEAMSPVRVIVIVAAAFLIFSAVALLRSTAVVERFLIIAVFSGYAAFTLTVSFTVAFLAACSVLLLILLIFFLRGWRSDAPTISEKQSKGGVYLLITAGLAAVFFGFAVAWTVGRVNSFCTPTYDFGIFAQMFHNMRETGLPTTTLERDGPLSHFAVHMSPIYYLMLPFYCLFPSAATLQVLQAAVIASAVIPLWLICRRHGLSPVQRLLVCTALLLYPAFMGGIGYDLHENCFLTPLILWSFYGLDRQSIAVTAIASILTLTVKEDAAVYVAVIAVYAIIRALAKKHNRSTRDLITGIVLLGVSLGYFFAVTGYLAESGDGVMTYRYGNLMYGGSDSLVSVICAVLLCPLKALFECVDPEKLKFIGLTLIPLLGLPLFTRRYERLILMIPYLLVNLMSDYQYQHDIFFQYCFGSIAFLMYLTAVNLSDIKSDGKRTVSLVAAVAISAGCFGAVVFPKGSKYPQYARDSFEYYESVRDILDTIPEGASVAATTYHTTYLSARETLYDIKYASSDHILECEYVVLKISEKSSYKAYATGGRDNGYANFKKLLEDNGYEEYEKLNSDILIMKKK